MSEHDNDSKGSDDLSPDALRAELAADRQRIAQLEAENAALAASRMTRSEAAPEAGRRTHRFWIVVLLVVGMVLTPVGILALFLRNELADPGRYIHTVKPLSSNPAIQSYVADEITKELFARVDIDTYVKDALPERAQALAGPLTGAVQSFVREATLRVIETDQFQKLWVDANRIAHAQLMNLLTGQHSDAISTTSNGAVQIDLSSVAKLVSDQLQSSGIDLFAKIPVADVGGKITLFQSKDLYKVRTAVGIINTLTWVLPLLVFGAFGGVIYLSRSRRRGFVRAAIAFTLGALALSLFLFVARGLYLHAATNNGLPYDAAAAVYDTLLRFLHTAVRAVLAFSIVVLIAVFFAGPSRLAVWFRAACALDRELARFREPACRLALARAECVRGSAKGRAAGHRGRAGVRRAGLLEASDAAQDRRTRHCHARRPGNHRVLRPRTCNRRGADPALRPADHHDDITVGLSSAELA